MPGDYDIDYCSPWAGANYQPYVCGSARAGIALTVMNDPGSAKLALRLQNGRGPLGQSCRS